ncbi:hypothetical protein BDK51DRAFT_53185 [Blyttiomyces helicus]|uniref:Uncharacterized protein n=1 Tax=Blyttiomyces helicus TaxID=388810 RepID=A0A4P9WEN6_9FUNG|nr:hypothetical protein BDK51DRAFT_53185 [Blyttiomyces helicus]|eukprot:RKO91189.1 hypothetical protein BDK51DRAFT_53185 [Blyttiomyces helicus]
MPNAVRGRFEMVPLGEFAKFAQHAAEEPAGAGGGVLRGRDGEDEAGLGHKRRVLARQDGNLLLHARKTKDPIHVPLAGVAGEEVPIFVFVHCRPIEVLEEGSKRLGNYEVPNYLVAHTKAVGAESGRDRDAQASFKAVMAVVVAREVLPLEGLRLRRVVNDIDGVADGVHEDGSNIFVRAVMEHHPDPSLPPIISVPTKLIKTRPLDMVTPVRTVEGHQVSTGNLGIKSYLVTNMSGVGQGASAGVRGNGGVGGSGPGASRTAAAPGPGATAQPTLTPIDLAKIISAFARKLGNFQINFAQSAQAKPRLLRSKTASTEALKVSLRYAGPSLFPASHGNLVLVPSPTLLPYGTPGKPVTIILFQQPVLAYRGYGGTYKNAGRGRYGSYGKGC